MATDLQAQQLRETIDALNAAARGMHEQATGHHAQVEAIRRIEDRVADLEKALSSGLKEIDGKMAGEMREAVAGIKEIVGEIRTHLATFEAGQAKHQEALTLRMSELERAISLEAQVEERTDAWRREVISSTGRVLSSKPVLALIAIFGFFFLQTLGIQMSPTLRDWVARNILGLPVAGLSMQAPDEN